MKPVFVGNFEYETRQSDLERLFGRYGRVERVDMKSGEQSTRGKRACILALRILCIPIACLTDYLLLTNGILLPFINSIFHIHMHHCMPSIT
ncbi:putative RNA recognition motif domain, nucleotide-binding alpha-beta plait domain superfamily [Helianthus anomalus]